MADPIQSHLQEEAWSAYRARLKERAQAFFDHRCISCHAYFRGTNAQARDRGWKKKWMKVSRGTRAQVDVCRLCRELRRARD